MTRVNLVAGTVSRPFQTGRVVVSGLLRHIKPCMHPYMKRYYICLCTRDMANRDKNQKFVIKKGGLLAALKRFYRITESGLGLFKKRNIPPILYSDRPSSLGGGHLGHPLLDPSHLPSGNWRIPFYHLYQRYSCEHLCAHLDHDI